MASNRYITRENVGDWVSDSSISLRRYNYLPYDHRLISRDDGRIYDIFAKDYGNNDKYITEQDFIFPFVYFDGKYDSNGIHSTSYIFPYKGNKSGGQPVGAVDIRFGYLDWDNNNYSIDNSNFFLSSSWKSDSSLSDSVSTFHNGNTHQIVITSSGTNPANGSCVYTYALFGLRMPNNTAINRLLTLVLAKYPNSSTVNPPEESYPEMVYVQCNFKNQTGSPISIYAIIVELTEYTSGGYQTSDGVFQGYDEDYVASPTCSPTGTPLGGSALANNASLTDFGKIYFNKDMFNENSPSKIGVRSITIALWDADAQTQHKAYEWRYCENNGAFNYNGSDTLSFCFGASATTNNNNRFYSPPCSANNRQVAIHLNITLSSWPED